MTQYPQPTVASYADPALQLQVEQTQQATSKLDRRLLLFLAVPQMFMLVAVNGTGLQGSALALVQIGVLIPSIVVSMAQPFYGIAMLFLIFPFDDLFAVAESQYFTISKLMAIGTVLGFLFRSFGGRYSLFPVERVGKAVVFFVIVILFSSIWAAYPLATLLRGMTPILLGILVCYGVQMIDTRERWETVLTALVLSGMFAATLMIFGLGSAKVGIGSQHRIFLGTGVNPNHTAVVMTISAYICFVMIFAGRSHLVRFIALFALPALGIGVLLTKSRASTAAFPFGLCMGVLLGLRQNIGAKVVYVGLILLAGLGTFTLAGLLGLIDVETIFSRWHSLGAASQTRETIAKVGFEMWKGAPFLGHGYGSYDLVYDRYATASATFGGGLGRDPHNLWIRIVAELGFVGIFPLAVLLVTLWVAAFKTELGAGRFLIVAILCAMGAISTSTSVIIYKYSWYSIMMIGATARLFPLRPEEAPQTELPPELAWTNNSTG